MKREQLILRNNVGVVSEIILIIYIALIGRNEEIPSVRSSANLYASPYPFVTDAMRTN